MKATQGDERVVSACLNTPLAALEIVRFHWTNPNDGLVLDDENHVLELCLTPRPAGARARYVDRWPTDGFMPVGTVCMVPAGMPMQALSAWGRQASIICRLRADAVRPWFAMADWTDRILEASLDIGSPKVRGLLLRLGEEARRPGLASDMLAETLAVELAIELHRYYADIPERTTAGGLAPWRLKLIDERMADGRSAPSLAELADACGLSIRQLTRGYRASRGVTIGAQLARLRIEGAKALLVGEASIGDVAKAMGFANASAFAFAFRRATGETPRRFRLRFD